MSYFASSDQLPEWARQIPRDWEKNWLKWNVSLSTARPDEDQRAALPYLSNEDIASWTGKLLREELEPHDADSRLFEPGDVLFNKLRPYLAKVFHADFAGTSSGELLCLRPSERVDARYLFYVLTSFGFIDAVDSHTFGSKMPRADWETVGHQPLPLPGIDVQQRIARFLDEKTARIDALIEKKQALLERLAEKRQALITRAVTKGLNPNVSMKQSSIPWIGEIPSHWTVKQLKRISPKVTVGIVVTPAAYYADDGVLAIRGLNVKPMEFDLSETRNISEEGHSLHLKSELHAGDLVAVRTGEPGTTAVVTDDLEGSNCVDLVIIRKTEQVSSRYIGWFLNSDVARTQYALGSEGALQLHFNVETSKNVLVCLPPLTEQNLVAEFIDRCLDDERQRAQKVEESVTLLGEYRNALITAAVTGQLPELND